MSFIASTLHSPFSVIKVLVPVFVTLSCDISARHGCPASSLPSSLCARLFLPLVLTLPLGSFEPSNLKSLTKVCFQPRRRLPWGLFNTSKHSGTYTPSLADPVWIFFFFFRYLTFKKKSHHCSPQAGLCGKKSFWHILPILPEYREASTGSILTLWAGV